MSEVTQEQFQKILNGNISDKDLDALIIVTESEYNDCKAKEFVEERRLGIGDEKYFGNLLNALKELKSLKQVVNE